MVKKETLGRQGKIDGQPAHTREVKLGCVFTQTTWDKEGYAIRDPDSTTYTGAIETAEEFGKRIYLEALEHVVGAERKRRWSSAMARNGSGIWSPNTFRARSRLSISTMLVSICGTVARQLYPHEEVQQKAWMKVHQKRLLDKGKIEKLVAAAAVHRHR